MDTQPIDKAAFAFVGRWCITEMEAWDADYFDMEAPAHITIDKNLTGDLQFGLMTGTLDGRVETLNGQSRFEFSWSGFDENDQADGRGWLQVDGDQAEGRIFMHLGDDSQLKAMRTAHSR